MSTSVLETDKKTYLCKSVNHPPICLSYVGVYVQGITKNDVVLRCVLFWRSVSRYPAVGTTVD